jgi:hypothetical protein
MIFGQHDAMTPEHDFHETEKKGERTVLMADGHAGYSMPIGGIAAYEFPAGSCFPQRLDSPIRIHDLKTQHTELTDQKRS